MSKENENKDENPAAKHLRDNSYESKQDNDEKTTDNDPKELSEKENSNSNDKSETGNKENETPNVSSAESLQTKPSKVTGLEHQLADGVYVGYYKLDKSIMSYGGIYYPKDMEIYYRGANTPEIRHWSTIDTKNEFDVMEHFAMIIKSCVKIVGGSWKDILETDRFRLVMLIQDVTFIEKPNNVMLNFDCISCSENSRYPLQYDMMQTKAIDTDFVSKYFDEERLSLVIPTKTLGEIVYRPSTLGTADLVFQFLKTQKPAFVKKHSSIILALPRLMESFRGLKPKDVGTLLERWYTWSPKKIAFLENLRDRVDYTMKENAELKCRNQKCQAINHVSIEPEDDFKYLFLRRDVMDDELA